MGIFGLLLLILFIYLFITHPEYFSLGEVFWRKHKTVDDRFNEQKQRQQDEIDQILDKIQHSGIESLTPKEKEKLDRFSTR